MSRAMRDALLLQVLHHVADDHLGLAQLHQGGDQREDHRRRCALDAGPQDRADLRLEHRQVLEAEADATGSPGTGCAPGSRCAAWVYLSAPRSSVRMTTGRSRRSSMHLAVGLVVVLLGGLGVAAEVEELGAVQADALRRPCPARCAASSGNSMLPSSVTSCPSRVTAGRSRRASRLWMNSTCWRA